MKRTSGYAKTLILNHYPIVSPFCDHSAGTGELLSSLTEPGHTTAMSERLAADDRKLDSQLPSTYAELDLAAHNSLCRIYRAENNRLCGAGERRKGSVWFYSV